MCVWNVSLRRMSLILHQPDWIWINIRTFCCWRSLSPLYRAEINSMYCCLIIAISRAHKTLPAWHSINFAEFLVVCAEATTSSSCIPQTCHLMERLLRAVDEGREFRCLFRKCLNNSLRLVGGGWLCVEPNVHGTTLSLGKHGDLFNGVLGIETGRLNWMLAPGEIPFVFVRLCR